MSAAVSPWTRARESRVVAQAVEFIRKRAELHMHRFAMEVGEHLFGGLFKGDRELVLHGGAWKKRAIRRIARDPRVKISADVLWACVHTYMSVELFRKGAPELPVPLISPWDWYRLSVPLGTDPAAMVEVALWIEREGVPHRLVRAVAQLVGPYVRNGGKLEDLLVGVEGERPFPDTPYRRIKRMFGVVDRWMDRNEMSDVARERTLVVVERLLDVV
jgi:hypothetical protein